MATTVFRYLRNIWLLSPYAERIFLLLAVILSACPALRAFEDERNASMVRFRCVKGFAAIVPVSIDGSVPYDFLLDTGATYTSIDTGLARDLALGVQGEASVTTLVHRIPVSFALAHTVRIGPIIDSDVEVLVRDLSGLRALDPRIRGVLGQNALDGADYLIDYKQKIVQFDANGDLLSSLHGERTPLTRFPVPGNPRHANLAVRIRLDDGTIGETRLLLDSGSASLVVFSSEGDIRRKRLELSTPHSIVQDVAGERKSAELRNVQLDIGGRRWNVTADVLDLGSVGEDIGGLLPTNMFLRIYISNLGRFVLFDPKIDRRVVNRVYAEVDRVASAIGSK